MTQDVTSVPLLLGIHGKSGYGKTYQCEYVLSEIGAKPFLISGGQLESHAAGEPAKIVRKTYLDASRCLEKGESKVAVVLINDIDTGLGNWGEMVQYTINRQTVFGELMHLVDYPTSVEGRTTRRIPIIITGNDFTKLYEPLVRAGRMTAFEWQPTTEEKAKIVSGIYPEISLLECENLVKELDREALANKLEPLPIAFFSHLRSTLTDDALWQVIQKVGIQQTVAQIARGYEPQLYLQIQFDRLLQAGKRLINSGQLVNHLRKT